MVNEIPKITYSGVDILYSEDRDVWLFSLNGRDRHADTLKNAKAAIDKPTPKQKTPFKRFKAFARQSYCGASYDLVEVTGVGEPDYSGNYRVWTVRDSDKKRTLERLDCLFVDNDANRVTFSAIAEMTKTIASIQEDREVLMKQLEKVKPSEDLV